MKYFFTFSLLALLSFQAVAQRNFKAGYIVPLNGDTTRGFVDYKEWNQNPRDISFKTTEQAAPQQYSPDNIKAFGIEQAEHYQKYTGPLTTGAVDLADLSSGIDSSFTTASVFLKIITSGKNLTLYSYNDKIKARYFIAEQSSAPVELKRYVYLDNTRSDRTREYNFYVQQLMALAIKYAPGNTGLAASIDKAPYRASDLKAIVLQLNGNTDKYKVKNAAGGGYQFFIGLGANKANASFFGNEKTGYMENIFTAKTRAQSVGPVIAGGVDFYFNKNVKKLFFRAELNLAMNKIQATYKGSYMDYLTKIEREEEVTFNQTAVTLNPQLVYNIYNANNLKFFVAGGFQLNFLSISNKHFYGQNATNGVPDNKKDNQLLYRPMTTGITAKTGVTLANKLDVYLGYGLPVMITNYPNQGIDMSFYRVGINYLLSKK